MSTIIKKSVPEDIKNKIVVYEESKKQLMLLIAISKMLDRIRPGLIEKIKIFRVLEHELPKVDMGNILELFRNSNEIDIKINKEIESLNNKIQKDKKAVAKIEADLSKYLG